MYIVHLHTGIVPIFCETLFKEVDEKRSEGSATEFQVFQFSDIHMQIIGNCVQAGTRLS